MLDHDQCVTMNISPQNTSPDLWKSVLRSTFVKSWSRQSAASLLSAHPRFPPSKTMPSAAHPCTMQRKSITTSTKESLFLRNWISFPQLNYQGSSSYPFAWAAGNSPPLPSHPVLWNSQCLWNSLDSEKHDWKRSFGQEMPQSKRGQWQTQRHRDQQGLYSEEPAKMDKSGQCKRTRRRTNPEIPLQTPTQTSLMLVYTGLWVTMSTLLLQPRVAALGCTLH